MSRAPLPRRGFTKTQRAIEYSRFLLCSAESPMPDHWIADRMRHIESSGIRKVFELARSLKDPVNLSIGQPHFDVPEAIKAAAHAAIERGNNAYTVTQGIPELREKILGDIHRRYSH